MSLYSRVHHLPLTLEFILVLLRNDVHARSSLPKKILDVIAPPFHHLWHPQICICKNRYNLKTIKVKPMVFGFKFVVTTRFIPILQEKTKLKKKLICIIILCTFKDNF